MRAHCLTFGGLAAAAVHAAIELRMCAEQSIDEHLCHAFSDLRHGGADLQGTGHELSCDNGRTVVGLAEGWSANRAHV